jgi:23S rRNA (adenine-N6)-dimethyltransferase
MARSHTHSQHFLRSPRLVAELIGHSNLRKNDTVYDLGAGSGIISSVLSRRVTTVFAVEVEPKALEKLHANVKGLNNVQIIEQDILTIEPVKGKYKIFSNIPFNLSSAIITHYTSLPNPPMSMYFIVQKQFANKLIESRDHFTNQLGAIIAPWFTVRIRKPLKKTDFTPPPAVDTALIEIKSRAPQHTTLIPITLKQQYIEFIRHCFESKQYFMSTDKSNTSIPPEIDRPSQLAASQWSELFTINRT